MNPPPKPPMNPPPPHYPALEFDPHMDWRRHPLSRLWYELGGFNLYLPKWAERYDT